jgi:hypothetical protein
MGIVKKGNQCKWQNANVGKQELNRLNAGYFIVQGDTNWGNEKCSLSN